MCIRDRLGLDVDFVRPGQSLKGYKLVLVPCLMHVSDVALAAFEQADGTVLFGPRTGSRDRHFRIPANLPPGPIGDLTGVRVTQVASLRPGLRASLAGAVNGQATRWREHIETQSDATVVATFEDGAPALVSKGRYLYLACWADGALLGNLMSYLASSLDLSTTAIPDFIRLRRAGKLTFAFNYGPDAWTIPGEQDFVLGEQEIAPFSLSAWK